MKQIVLALLGIAVVAAGPGWLKALLLVAVLSAVGTSGCCLLLQAAFPAQVAATQRKLESHPFRCLLLGWLLLLSQILVLSVTQSPLLGVVFALLDTSLLWLGLSGLSVVLAERIPGGPPAGWRRTVFANGVLCSTLGLPLFGWLAASQVLLAALGSTVWKS